MAYFNNLDIEIQNQKMEDKKKEEKMALQFVCEECQGTFIGNDETYCQGCFEELKEKAADLEREIERLKEDIKCYEKEIEDLKDDIKNLENEAMNSGYDPRKQHDR